MLKHLAMAAVVASALCLTVPASACNKPKLQGCVAPELRLLGGMNGCSASTKLNQFRGKPVLIEFQRNAIRPLVLFDLDSVRVVRTDLVKRDDMHEDQPDQCQWQCDHMQREESIERDIRDRIVTADEIDETLADTGYRPE